MSESMTLSQKLLAIMVECEYIQKDKENSFHKYRYASEAAIKTKLHEALLKHRVLFHMSATGIEERPTADGKQWVTTQHFEYWFEDVDSGEKTERKGVKGTGADALDKGCFKSHTGALKYALTTQFLIPTGDDPENETRTTIAEKKQRAAAVAQKKIENLAPPAAPAAKSHAVPDKFKMLKEFGTVKADLHKLDPTDKPYYEVLGINGFEHSDQIKTHEDASRVYKALKARYAQELEAIGVTK